MITKTTQEITDELAKANDNIDPFSDEEEIESAELFYEEFANERWVGVDEVQKVIEQFLVYYQECDKESCGQFEDEIHAIRLLRDELFGISRGQGAPSISSLPKEKSGSIPVSPEPKKQEDGIVARLACPYPGFEASFVLNKKKMVVKGDV